MILVVLLIIIGVIGAILLFYLQSSQNKKKIDRARDLYKTEKYKQALEVFQELYAKDSGNKLYNWYIGQCYEKLENYELALVEYNKASLSTVFEPPLDEAEVHKRIAFVSFELGNINKAYQELQIVTTLDYKDAESYFYLGQIAKNKGELQKGLEYFEKAFRYKKEYPEAYLEHGKLNSTLNHTDKAKRSFLKAINQNPDLSEAHFHYALILEKDKIFQKSIEEFQLALKDDTYKFDSFVHLATIFTALSDEKTSFEYFEKALEFGTENMENLLDAEYKYANYLIQTGDLNKALKLWNDIHTQDANYKDVENKIQVYGEISKSSNLTRFITSNKEEFVRTGNELCKVMHIKVGNYSIQKGDLLEFIGTYRAGRDDMECVVHLVKWTNQVGEIPVRELLESVVEEGVAKGIFITPARFSEKAHDLSKIRPLELIERERLEGLLSKVYSQT